MNDSIGAYSKLRDPRLSWEKKICIARNAWRDEKCFIPNKQQVLLDWVCQKLLDYILYKKDKRTSVDNQASPETKDLWAYLKDILQSLAKPVIGEDIICIPLTLMPQFVQVFANIFSDHSSSKPCRLTDDSVMLDVIHCGRMILSSSSLNTSLLSKFENYVKFISSLLSSFVVSTANNPSMNHDVCKEMICLLEVALSLYNSLQRKQTNHRKLFERTCEYMVGPLLAVRYILKNINPEQRDACEITQDRIASFVHLQHKILSDALFRRENLSDYSSTLQALKDKNEQEDTTEPQSKRVCSGNYTKLLFATLKNLLDSSKDTNQEALMDSLPQLYIEFLTSRRENKMSSSSLEFEFFTEMCVLLGIVDENMVENKCDKHFLSSVLPHVSCLLDTILTFDVYQVADDNANDGIQLKWFLNFTKLLLRNLPSFDVYRCLEVLLNLNHCIIEPHLASILQHMYGCHKVADDVSSCESFLSSVVKTYVKLRQFDKLITQMLVSLRTAEAMKHMWRGFPDLVRDELIKAVQSLPYGTSTSLWKAINEEILHTYLPALRVLEEGEPRNQEEEQTNRLVFSLERVVGLYSLFLLNTTLGGVIEQHRVESTQRTLSSLFHGSVSDVFGPLWDVLSTMRDNKIFSESAAVSMLMLFHALQEIKIFLDKLRCISDDLDVYWEKYISTYLNKNANMKGKNPENERIKYLLVLLCIQRIRIQLLQAGSAHSEEDFQHLLDYIFSFSDSISYCSSLSWNKQVWTIDETSFSLAYWYSLCHQAPLLLSVCSKKELLKFTQCLIQSLVSADMEPASNQNNINGNVLSIQCVSKTLLHNADTHQVPSMQDCLVSSIWLYIGGVLSLCDFDAQPQKKLVDIVKALGTLLHMDDVNESDMDIDKEREDIQDSEDESVSASEDEEEVSQVQKTENQAVSPLTSLGKTLNSVLDELEPVTRPSNLDSEQLKTINQGLMILAHLPLDWLTDVNHSSCILGLVSCDTLIYSNLQQVESMECRKVLYLGRRLLTILLNGCISKKRFIIQHIISMDSFLSWMMSWYMKPCQTETGSYSEQLESTSIHLSCTGVKYSLKTASSSSTVYCCIIKFTDGIAGLTEELNNAPYSSLIGIVEKNSQFLRIFSRVLAVLEKVIACKTSKLNEVRMAVKVVAKMAPSLLDLLGAITTKSEKKGHSKTIESAGASKCVEPVLQGLPVLVESYTAVLHIYCLSQTSRKLSKIKEEFEHWQWRPILPSILIFAIKSLQNPQEDSTTSTTATKTLTKSCLHFLDVIFLSLETLKLDLPQDFHCSLMALLLNFLNQLQSTEEDSTLELRERALESVLSLLVGSPFDTLVVLLKGLCNELTTKILPQGSVHRVSTCIHVWSMILTGRFPKLKKKELCPVLPRVLMGLQSILQMSTGNISLSVLTLEVMTKLLSLGKSFIQPHHCTMAFHGSLLQLLGDNKQKFSILFHAQYSLLSSILFHQSEAVYNSIHVFVTCVKNMLCSLGEHCNQRYAQGVQDKLNPESKKQLESELVCAQKMARLYQEIATHKTYIAKYAPYMITDYIQQIQQVSLQSHVKQALVSGVYCLLDMCGEHEKALLHAVLDKGSRELLNSLNDDYNKFHKFKGKV